MVHQGPAGRGPAGRVWSATAGVARCSEVLRALGPLSPARAAPFIAAGARRLCSCPGPTSLPGPADGLLQPTPSFTQRLSSHVRPPDTSSQERPRSEPTVLRRRVDARVDRPSPVGPQAAQRAASVRTYPGHVLVLQSRFAASLDEGVQRPDGVGVGAQRRPRDGSPRPVRRRRPDRRWGLGFVVGRPGQPPQRPDRVVQPTVGFGQRCRQPERERALGSLDR
jgi:hypothetical protein